MAQTGEHKGIPSKHVGNPIVQTALTPDAPSAHAGPRHWRESGSNKLKKFLRHQTLPVVRFRIGMDYALGHQFRPALFDQVADFRLAQP